MSDTITMEQIETLSIKQLEIINTINKIKELQTKIYEKLKNKWVIVRYEGDFYHLMMANYSINMTVLNRTNDTRYAIEFNYHGGNVSNYNTHMDNLIKEKKLENYSNRLEYLVKLMNCAEYDIKEKIVEATPEEQINNGVLLKENDRLKRDIVMLKEKLELANNRILDAQQQKGLAPGQVILDISNILPYINNRNY